VIRQPIAAQRELLLAPRAKKRQPIHAAKQIAATSATGIGSRLGSGFAASFQSEANATLAIKRLTVTLAVKRRMQIAARATTAELNSDLSRYADFSNALAMRDNAAMVVLILAVRRVIAG
jgi:hypothetical protein